MTPMIAQSSITLPKDSREIASLPLSGTKAASVEVFFRGPQNPAEKASLKWYLYSGPELNMDFFNTFMKLLPKRSVGRE